MPWPRTGRILKWGRPTQRLRPRLTSLHRKRVGFLDQSRVQISGQDGRVAQLRSCSRASASFLVITSPMVSFPSVLSHASAARTASAYSRLHLMIHWLRLIAKKINTAADGQGAHEPILPDCPYEDEEIFEGLCYTKCSLLTMGRYAIRTAMNTCSNHDYGGEWTLGFGPCSGFGIGGTKCLPHMPKAFGAGFDQPNRRPGIGPFGWTQLHLPDVPAEFAPPP